MTGDLLATLQTRYAEGIPNANYWSIDSWNILRGRLRRLRPRDPYCEIGRPSEVEDVVQPLWAVP